MSMTGSGLAQALLEGSQECCDMFNRWHEMLTHPGFWDRKMRIAILTLATFIALC
jgi:hypothetical protein